MGEVLLHLVAQPAPGVAAVGGPRQLWARKLKRKNPRRKGTHLPSSERVGMHVDDTLPQTNMEDPLEDLVHLTEYSAWWQNEAGKRECAKTFTWSANADAFLLRLQPDLITYSSLIRPLASIRKLMYARVRILQRKLLVTGGFVCVCLCVWFSLCFALCMCVRVFCLCLLILVWGGPALINLVTRQSIHWRRIWEPSRFFGPHSNSGPQSGTHFGPRQAELRTEAAARLTQCAHLAQHQFDRIQTKPKGSKLGPFSALDDMLAARRAVRRV